MIDKLEKLQSKYVAAQKFDTADQVEDQVTIYGVTLHKQAVDIMHDLVARRNNPEAKQKLTESAAVHLKKMLQNILILVYCTDLPLPTEDDLQQMIDGYADEITVDGVLSACLVSKSVSDFMLFYFCDPDDKGELVMCFLEMLSGIAMLADRFDTSLDELLT